MKNTILNMVKFFLVLLSMIIAIIVGIFALYYSIKHSALNILIFIIGLCGLGLGLFTLNVVADKLK
tara:strand:+ start:66 stop:263 length:198 start_codon:yes stop_codon:yes gene_type:complete